MPDPTTIARPQLTPDQLFSQRVSYIAKQQCNKLLGTERGQQAAQRITMSVLASMQAARDPGAFHACTDLSLANCIGLSAQTGLLSGGPSPTVYLVPQAPRKGESPELQWRITHRGIAVLAYRAGFAIRAVPVDSEDFLQVSLGEVVEHTAGPDSWPLTFDDLRGIAVIVRDIERGRDVIRAWVPAAAIALRRKVARDQSVWQAWPVEMAQKTAIKYCLARGSIPMDSPELTAALEADATGDAEPAARTVDAHAAPRATARAAIGLDTAPPTPDYTAEAERLAARERVPVAAAPQDGASTASPGVEPANNDNASQEAAADGWALKAEAVALDHAALAAGIPLAPIRERHEMHPSRPIEGLRAGAAKWRAYGTDLRTTLASTAPVREPGDEDAGVGGEL